MNLVWIAMSIHEKRKYNKYINFKENIKQYFISNLIISFL